METEAKKGALTAAQRQAKRREKAAEQGLKSVSVGLIKIEHEQAFKDAAKASREGKLDLGEGGLFQVVTKEVFKEKPVRVTKIVRVLDLEPIAQRGGLIATISMVSVLFGGFLGWLLFR